MIILLYGHNKTGKSTLANQLENFGYKKYSFAHYIKEYIKNNHKTFVNNHNKNSDSGIPFDRGLSIELMGGNKKDIYKNNYTGRGLLIRTAYRFTSANPYHYAYNLINSILENNHKNIVIDDIRKFYELELISKKFLCKFIRVEGKFNRKDPLRPNEVLLDNIIPDIIYSNIKNNRVAVTDINKLVSLLK